MIYTLNPTLANNLQLRIIGIFTFAVISGIAAQVSIPLEPVPVTFQVLTALLAGLILGWRDGFASQVTYLSMILIGLPLASNGGAGLAAFQTPSAGYLFAFPVGAAVTGFLAVKDHVVVRWLASLAGVIAIYIIGATYLKVYLGSSWEVAWTAGVAPFIALDIAKAVFAAVSGEGLHRWWSQQFPPN